MDMNKTQDAWFVSFQEGSKIGQRVAYSTLILFFLLSLFLNYSPYAAGLSSNVLSSGLAARVIGFPFVSERYNEMQAYDGVSGDKYIISTVYALCMAALFGVLFFFEYLFFVVFAGKIIRRSATKFFPFIYFIFPVVVVSWAIVFLLPLESWKGGIIKSGRIFAWPTFPIFSTFASVMLCLSIVAITSGLVKLAIQIFMRGDEGHE